MKIRYLSILLFWVSALPAQQIADSVYWVYFTDKAGNGYEISEPEAFLSERSVARRAWQGLAIDQTDEPVTQTYLDEIRGMGVDIRHISRWLNGIAMANMDSGLFLQVLAKPFTDTVQWEPERDEHYFPPVPSGERFEPPLSDPPGYDYGIAMEQVHLMNLHLLHDQGYTGKGVRIAVLDAGFRNVDSLPSFDNVIGQGRLLDTRNYVNMSPLFRQQSAHGMYVLSTMAAEWEGNMVGTAPHASYILCMTEDPDRETRIEEIAWIEAAEYVDSLGFDVINTSLGYSEFDGNGYDYTYRDMDGRSTFISRAASMTASKGIIACISAGNSGRSDWYYITAPADAYDILAVGALDSGGQASGWSSRGPSFDTRIKPDISAMGVATGIQSLDGGVTRHNGTSFAAPLIAGSVACLWQAFPEMPAREMIHMIRQGSDRRKNPDVTYGFGIPNFTRTYWSISHVPARFVPGQIELYPNPASHRVMVRIPEDGPGSHTLKFYDVSGKLIDAQRVTIPGEVQLPGSLARGLYLLEISTQRGVYRSKLILE